jgi:hypothetical protein
VPQDAGSQAAKRNTAISLGPNTLRLPAIFVPEGSSPPGYPYVHFGKMTLDQDANDGAGQTTLPGPKGSESTGVARQGMPQSQSGIGGGPYSQQVAADRGSRGPDNIGRQASAPMAAALDDRHTPPDGVVGRAASLASSYFDTANGASASQYGTAGSPLPLAAGRDDPALHSLDPSGDAIEAALRALAVSPSTGEPPQGADRETLANLPPE